MAGIPKNVLEKAKIKAEEFGQRLSKLTGHLKM